MLDLLKGIRVLSFNHFLLGPMGVQVLGDLGADVIAVESPEGSWQRSWASGNIWPDGQSALHLCANRNKKSLALDLKSAKGREIALRLADKADVIAENFRPGVMDKLGLGYAALKARNGALIYASASGYGPDGPYVEKPGQDLLAQALFGVMAITGSACAPRPVGASVIDHHGAALFAMGILAALVRRQRTGQGCRVDASLMQAALDLQAESLVAWSNAGANKPAIHARQHVAGWYFAAPYGVYATSDGHLALSLSPLEKLAEALPEPKLAAVSQEDSWLKGEEIAALIASHLKTATTREWMARMERLNVWHAPVRGYDEILADPQVTHIKALISIDGTGCTRGPITLVNHPLLYDGAAAEARLPPQRLGAQTREVLREIGLDDCEIACLARDKVVALAEE